MSYLKLGEYGNSIMPAALIEKFKTILFDAEERTIITGNRWAMKYQLLKKIQSLFGAGGYGKSEPPMGRKFVATYQGLRDTGVRFSQLNLSNKDFQKWGNDKTIQLITEPG